jgi:hypothetical protein
VTLRSKRLAGAAVVQRRPDPTDQTGLLQQPLDIVAFDCAPSNTGVANGTPTERFPARSTSSFRVRAGISLP